MKYNYKFLSKTKCNGEPVKESHRTDEYAYSVLKNGVKRRLRLFELMRRSEVDEVAEQLAEIKRGFAEDFNEEQRAAIETTARHALVLAGAGTEKTKTIIGRAAHLLQTGVREESLLLITFTKRAANEIRSRINAACHQSVNVFAGTFHSWAMQLIRRNPNIFKLDPPTLLDTDDSLTIFRKFRRSLQQSNPPQAAKMAGFHSLMVNTRLGTVDVAALAEIEDDLIPVFMDASRHYTDYKHDHRYIDYDDILERLAEGLQDTELASAIGKRFSHILIDEMQDTNPLQYLIIDALAPQASLFCVGDDAQSIYGFRGADFESIHSFTDRYPTAEVLKLKKNYRSTQEILDLSNWLLVKSPLNYDKTLTAARGYGEVPKLIEREDAHQQADYIAQTILEAYDCEQRWRNNMVLVRTGYSGRSVESKFLQYKIPHILIGGVSLFGAKHVKDVVSLLRILANQQDEIAWMRYLQLWPRVGERTADRLFQAIAFGDDAAVTWPTDSDSLLHVVEEFSANDSFGWTQPLIRCLQGSASPVAAFECAVDGLTPRMSALYQNDHWETRKKDFEYVGELARKHRTISAFVDEYLLNPVYESDLEKSAGDDKVTIITIHSAKGLEAPRCFVTDVQPGSYPKTGLSEVEIEEERRVLYVALTRAANELHVCRCQRGWASRYVGLDTESYFLNGLPDGLVEPEMRIDDSSSETGFAIKF